MLEAAQGGFGGSVPGPGRSGHDRCAPHRADSQLSVRDLSAYIRGLQRRLFARYELEVRSRFLDL